MKPVVKWLRLAMNIASSVVAAYFTARLFSYPNAWDYACGVFAGLMAARVEFFLRVLRFRIYRRWREKQVSARQGPYR